VPELEVRVEGNKRIVRATFRVPDDTGALTDPSAVTFTARRQLGGVWQTPTPYVYLVAGEVTRASLGVFEFTFIPGEGTWAVHVQGTGTAYAAAEVEFIAGRAKALV
jgi:hypothetical protein